MLEWLKQRTGRAIVAVIVLVLVAGLAMSFPPDFALLMAADLTTWVEAALAVYVATQLTRVRPILIFLRAKLFGRLRISRRQPRTRTTKPTEETNDDEPAPRLAFA